MLRWKDARLSSCASKGGVKMSPWTTGALQQADQCRLEKRGQTASVWCDGHMRLTKELGGAAGVGEEPGVWVCVFSQMVQLWTAARDGVWVPQTSSVPAASLSAVPVAVWLQDKLSCLFSVEPVPKKKEVLHLISSWTSFPYGHRIAELDLWGSGWEEGTKMAFFWWQPAGVMRRRFETKPFLTIAETGAKKLVVHMGEEWVWRRHLKRILLELYVYILKKEKSSLITHLFCTICSKLFNWLLFIHYTHLYYY